MYLNNILIYTKDPGQPHVEAVRWVLDQLQKYSLFANLKKCRFHQNEIWFLGYVVFFKGICMEDERIEVIKDWLEPKSVQDIQVFIGFANFYRRFIQGFSRIAAPLTSMLKATSVALVKKASFLTPEAKLAFTQLWQAFTEAPILHHFDPKCHI